MHTSTMELQMDDLADVTGGVYTNWADTTASRGVDLCDFKSHHHVRTGREREDSVFFFWSRHQIEMYLGSGNRFRAGRKTRVNMTAGKFPAFSFLRRFCP